MTSPYCEKGPLKPHPETIALARKADKHAEKCYICTPGVLGVYCNIRRGLSIRSSMRLMEHARDFATVDSLNATMIGSPLTSKDLTKYRARLVRDIKQSRKKLKALNLDRSTDGD